MSLPAGWAYDMLLFGRRNPQPVPLLDVTDAGSWHPVLAPEATDVGAPDFGDAVEPAAEDIPVFWACGVTPQSALMASRPPFAITHAPSHMFVTDIPDSRYCQL